MSENRKAIQQFILIIGLIINLISFGLYNSTPGLHLILLGMVIPIFFLLSLGFYFLGFKTSYQQKSTDIAFKFMILGILQSWTVFILNGSVQVAVYIGLISSVITFILNLLMIRYHKKLIKIN